MQSLTALRISMGDITYDQVDLIEYNEIEALGFECIFEDQTIMFRYQRRWFTSHAYNLKLIHIDRFQRRPREGIEFDKLVIDEDKIYGPGTIIRREDMANYGIPIFWENGFETQLCFTCKDGLFVTTDFSIDTICYPRKAPFLQASKVRPGRSSIRETPRVSNVNVRTRPASSTGGQKP